MSRLYAFAAFVMLAVSAPALAAPALASQSVQDLPMPRPFTLSVPDLAGKMALLASRAPSPENALCLGVMQVFAKRYPEAAQTLAPVAARAPALAGWSGFFLGYAKFRQGDYAGALAELDRIASGDAAWGPEALLLSAYCLEGMNSPQALARYSRFLELPDQPLRPAALWRAAAVASDAGDFTLAEDCLRELMQTTPWTVSAERAEPLALELFRSGRIPFDPDSPDSLRSRIEILLDKSQTAKAQPLIERYASSPGADQARALYLKGKVLYAKRDTTAAMQYFEDAARLSADPLLAGWSVFHQARAMWRLSGPEDAARMETLLADCLRRAAALPDGADLAETSRRLLMLLRLERGRTAEALAAARELAVPGIAATEAREQAAWLTGLLLYTQGDYASAEPAFTAFLAAYPTSDALPGAHYWIARTREAAGDIAQARAALRMVLARWPNGYYGLLASNRLAGMAAKPGPETGLQAPQAASPENDPLAALQSGANPPSSPGVAPSQPSPPGTGQPSGACAVIADPPVPPEARAVFDRAAVLEAGLLPELAERELAALSARMPRDPAVALRYARLATSLGSHQLAVRAVSRAFQPCLTRGTREELRPLRDIVYPNRYQDQVNRNLAGTGVDPDIIRGLIRQESFFEPEAASGAGALGLMQLMPATARTQAEKYGEKGFKVESLKDPAVNIRYGVRYFLERYGEYEGNLACALASYNAGRVKVGVWKEFLGGLDQELFVEFIPYTETREYVKRIMGNRAMYALLY